MKTFFARYKVFLGVLGSISAVILALFYNALRPQEKLPIYQPAIVNYELVDSSYNMSKSIIKLLPSLLLIKMVKPLRIEITRIKSMWLTFFSQPVLQFVQK